MDTFLGLSSAAWTALFTLGLLVVAILAAGYAHRQWTTSREQGNDARRAEQERLRPYVIVTAEPSVATRKLFDLVIRNIGMRPAIKVRVTLDPTPRRAREDTQYALADAKMLTEPIAQIAPGQELRMFYDSHIDRNGRDDLPTSHRARIRYQDTSGQEFDESSTVDLEAGRGAANVDVYSVHDAAKALHAIEKRLETASVLQRSGSLEVDAACERREEKRDRVRQQREEAIREYENITRRVLPNQTKESSEDSDPDPST